MTGPATPQEAKALIGQWVHQRLGELHLEHAQLMAPVVRQVAAMAAVDPQLFEDGTYLAPLRRALDHFQAAGGDAVLQLLDEKPGGDEGLLSREDLDALPEGSVIADADGCDPGQVWQKHRGAWFTPGHEDHYPVSVLRGSVSLLRRGNGGDS